MDKPPITARELPERFWANVDKSSGCWLWTRSLNSSGYAQYGWRPRLTSHRLAYEALVGPIPDGLELDHLCKVRHCVNPAHLEPVTRRENIMRSNNFAAVCARKTHCPAGHPYAGENLYIIKSTRGRVCKTCHRERQRARAA